MKTFEEEWRQRFERFAHSHAADHLISGWSSSGLRCRLALFKELLSQQHLPAPARVLDLGCGTGSYVRTLTDLGHWVIGLDYSLPSLSRALTMDPKRAAHYMEGEAYHLAFRDGSFDLVISIGVFQTLEYPERALDEIVRILRPKGLLVVEFLNAFEPVALVNAIGARFRGQLPRVRAYSPFQMEGWLTHRGLKIIQRAGIYLPPRGLPWLERVFQRRGVVRTLEGIPNLSLVGAHAFFLLGEKEAH